jgi:hypothetical protein
LLGFNSSNGGIISERPVTCETSFSSFDASNAPSLFRLLHGWAEFSSTDRSSSSPRYDKKKIPRNPRKNLSFLDFQKSPILLMRLSLLSCNHGWYHCSKAELSMTQNLAALDLWVRRDVRPMPPFSPSSISDVPSTPSPEDSASLKK